MGAKDIGSAKIAVSRLLQLRNSVTYQDDARILRTIMRELKGKEMENLLECPWCGMSADLELQASPQGFFYVQVRCSNKKCLATCPHGMFSTENMSMEKAEKKAFERWNKRSPRRKTNE